MILDPSPKTSPKTTWLRKIKSPLEKSIESSTNIKELSEISVKDQSVPGTNCVKCPDTTPRCKNCLPDQVCVLSAQTCHSCAKVYCIEAIATTSSSTLVQKSITPSSTMSQPAWPSLDEEEVVNNEHTTVKQRAVIGGTVGGIFFFYFIFWIIFWLRRSRRRKNKTLKQNIRIIPTNFSTPVLQLESTRYDSLSEHNVNIPGASDAPNAPDAQETQVTHDAQDAQDAQLERHERNELASVSPNLSTNTTEYRAPPARDHERNIAKRIKNRTSMLLLRRSTGRLLTETSNTNSNESAMQHSDRPRLILNSSQDLQNTAPDQSSNAENLPIEEMEDVNSFINWNQARPTGSTSISLVPPDPPKLPSLRLLPSTQSLVPSRFGSDTGSIITDSYTLRGNKNRVSIVSGTGTDIYQNPQYNAGSGIRLSLNRSPFSGDTPIGESSSSGSSSHQAPLPPLPTRGSYIPIGYVAKGVSYKTYQRESERYYTKQSFDSQYSRQLSSKRTSSVYSPPSEQGGGFNRGLQPVPGRDSRKLSKVDYQSDGSPELSYPTRMPGHDLTNSDRYTKYLQGVYKNQSSEDSGLGSSSNTNMTTRQRLYEAAKLSSSTIPDIPDRYLPRFLASSSSHLQSPPQTLSQTPGNSKIRPLSLGKWRNTRVEQETIERDSFEYPVLFDNDQDITFLRSKSKENK